MIDSRRLSHGICESELLFSGLIFQSPVELHPCTMTDNRIKDSPKPVYQINRNKNDVCKKISMAKSKSTEITESRKTKDLGVSGAHGENEKYDPALVSLFARSVSKVQLQSM